jgi:hypothetical protein
MSIMVGLQSRQKHDFIECFIYDEKEKRGSFD